MPENRIDVLDHGFVRLDAAMADDLSVVNAARVSFARRREEMDDADAGLVRFLMRDRHGTPFEHNAFRFHVRCPIFVAREWFRHRIGCITGDTKVTFVNTEGHTGPVMTKTVDELWEAWSAGERDGHAPGAAMQAVVAELLAAGGSERAVAAAAGVGRRVVRPIRAGEELGRRSARARIRRMRVRVLDEETGEFTSSHIADVVDKGVQPVYRVTLADGKSLTLTENHRVLTDRGWTTMGEALGLEHDLDGVRTTRACLLMVNGAPLHQSRDWLARRRASGASVADLREPEGAPPTGRRLAAHAVRVAAVEYVGLRQTFDLCIDGPWHNFVANGIVVHNSFNEFSMRYAKATDDFYVPDAADVRTQVGKPGAYSFEPVDAELAERTREELQAVYEHAYATYERLVEAGVARELARSAIPVGAYTEFYWTVNARALMNFVSLRAAESAQREIRRYAEAVERLFAERMPVTHEAFVANRRNAP